MKKFFTRNKNNHAMEVRSSEFYKVEKYQTERFGKSAIPFMIKMLNDKDVSSLAGCDPATTGKSRTIVPFKKI